MNSGWLHRQVANPFADPPHRVQAHRAPLGEGRQHLLIDLISGDTRLMSYRFKRAGCSQQSS